MNSYKNLTSAEKYLGKILNDPDELREHMPLLKTMKTEGIVKKIVDAIEGHESPFVNIYLNAGKEVVAYAMFLANTVKRNEIEERIT